MNFGIIGAGAWGLALADLLANKGYQVTCWEYNEGYRQRLVKEREVPEKLKGFKISDVINFTDDLPELIENSEIIVNAVATQFIRSYFPLIKDLDFSQKTIVNVSKGIEVTTGKDISTIFKDEFDTITDDNFAVLAGPSFAYEVAVLKTPTAVLSACKNIETANKIRDVFSCEYFRAYSSTDIIGVEVGGSIKNILAIASGILSGLNLGGNAKAALLTRGLAEMKRFGLKVGAEKDTFAGLSGIGDMILTCNSDLSRNFQVGYRIGTGESLADILKSMPMVAEGVETCRSVKKISNDLGVEMPITEAVYSVLFNNIDPKKMVKELMMRNLKKED